MSAEPYLPIFNPPAPITTRTFHLFPSLPKELRLLIWQYALHRQRIVKIHLSDPWIEDTSTIAQRITAINTNNDPETQTAGYYTVTTDTHPVHSKFLRVCKESRKEALMFYRAHIPCRLVKEAEKDNSYWGMKGLLQSATIEGGVDKVTEPGTLYLNPEWDFLRITAYPHEDVHIPAFLHHLKSRYDPKGIGLLNLIISDRDHENGILGLDAREMTPEGRTAMGDTLRSLESVFFGQTATVGRMNFGYADGELDTEMWFNRSFPICTEISAFQRLDVDPRPIGKDLMKQCMGGRDWKEQYYRFTRLLDSFNLPDNETTTQFQFMLAFTARVYTRKDAEKWLRNDYERLWGDRRYWPKDKKRHADMGAEYVMDVEPAFGFWLFGLDVLKAPKSEGSEHLLDVRLCRPQLAVTVMPGS
jgi:hypothetical protein